MNRQVDKPVQISEKRHRYTQKIFDDPSEPGTEATKRLVLFLREFIDQPALLRCGPAFSQKMAIYHNGTCWVMASEAESDEP